MRTIKLSKCEVDIKDALTWGDAEAVQGAMLGSLKVGNAGIAGIDGHALSEGKYKLLEICVIEVREGDKKSKFSRDWMNNLPIEDGDLLYGEVEKLQKKTAK